ncbi:MAG: ATP-binding protein [Opitutales bacterium]
MILYCLISSFLNAAASLVLGGVVFSKKPRDARTITFTGVTLFVALWSAFYFLWQTADSTASALVYIRWFSAAAIPIPVLYFHFTTKLTGRERPREVLAGYLISLPFVPLSFTSWIVTGLRPKLMFPWWPDPGRLYPFYLAVFFYFILRSWQLLFQEYRAARFLRRNQLLYVFAYTVIGFAGGATNFLLWYDLPVPPVGNILVGVYMIGVGYAVVRFRLMEFDLLMARLLAYGILVGILAALIPLLTAVIAWFHVAGGGNVSLFMISLPATGLLFWLIPALRQRVDALLEQRVLGDRLSNRELLRSLAGRLSSAQGEPELYHDVVAGLTAALDVDDVALYTRTEFETDFTRRAGAGADVFPEPSPLARTLRESQRSLLLDEVAHGPADERRGYFQELRRKQGIEMAVPVFGDSFFYGFITLGPRRGHALYTDADVSLLEAIGLQVGLNLRARQLERRTSQTEKLISLGTLAAGLAHELRNPLTSIQTFSALLKERHPDPEALQEFSAVVQRDVNRIASIVENVAAFAESNKVDMTAVQLAEVLRAVADIVRPELQRTGTRLVLPAGPEPAPILGNHSQLLQVFINLVQNALQALEGRPDACITVEFEARRTSDTEPLVCVTVGDNGPGIDAAVLPYIFEPFTTTKATGERRGKHGMGLGLAIVKRIIQHHHGEIHVDSQPGQGTVFRVYLPLLART